MNAQRLLVLLLLFSSVTFSAWAGTGAEQTIKVPPRDPAAGTNLIDLTAHYNAELTETWHPASNMAGDSGNDLSELPRGVQKLAEVQFDLRGVIQVSSDGTGNRHGPYPKAVEGIKIGCRCRALHFLHGAGFVDRDGQKIGSYCVHFADGQVRKIPVVYGEDVRDWWAYGQRRSDTKRAVVAWRGQNAATKANDISLQLYRLTWRNPRPDVRIKSTDFKASPARSIPFLVAITAEPPKQK